MLLPGDGPENYREVTPAERERLEQADAAWQRPPQAFIDHWRARAEDFGGYNEQTGFFELNEITDIDYDEALAIDSDSFPACVGHTEPLPFYGNSYPRGRTLFSIKAFGRTSCSHMYSYCTTQEVLRVREGNNKLRMDVTDMREMFRSSWKLRRILGTIRFTGNKDYALSAFTDCNALEDVTIWHYGETALTLVFKHSPLLSLHSIQQLVELKTSAQPTTVTLHADTFAKLTAELIAQAAEKQITFQTA